MHRLIPGFVIEQYAAGHMEGDLPAVALFVDISGFSTITDALMVHGQHGAEVLATLMRAVFDPLIRSVYEHGGFIVTFAGDAFTALFPLEGSQTRACWDALAAAWNIQRRMADVAQQTTPYGTFSLAAKAGLAVGDVSWGIVSSEDGSRAAYYFQGQAIDGCAAAEHLANPGDVILGADFFAVVQEAATAAPVADHYRLTGISAVLPAARELGSLPADLDIMARFHRQGLVTRAFSGEFRDVVSMMISLPTVRTATQLTIFMQSMFTLQDRYGGLLNGLDFGDKGSNLLLFWGAPVAYENDVERALDFILDLQTRTSIPINAGVTYRIAHAGYVGSPLREDYTCFGRGVNLAARFMTTAPRGEIWLDEEVARRAEPHFDVEFEGERVFKGFAEKQQVYVLYERKERVDAFFEGELVGREAELAQLHDFLEPLWEGMFAGTMVVRGEPGIGKSRLVHALQRELSSALEEEGTRGEVSWFLCQTDEILRESLNPFRYWLRRYFGQVQAQTESRRKRGFNRTLDRLIDAMQDEDLAGELDRTRSFLGALVDLHWPDSLYEQLEPQGRYENTLRGLTALLCAESLQQPVVVHLEDAQWLDEDSKAFLAHLALALRGDERKTYPMALIVTARPSGSEPLLGEGLAYQEVDLAQLSRDGLARLVEAQLGGTAAPALLELLAERADGNPFFAEQIVRYLQEGDFLASSNDGWQLVEVTVGSLLPADVRAVLVARLDQLAQEVKEVVQSAAVLGREFEVQLLTRMLQGDEVLPRKLTEAERAAIWLALSQLRYLFTHALLRDTAYRMQVHSRRQALHQLAVEALESVYEADLSAHYGELAYHCEQAGLGEKARRYLRLAGDAAGEAYQNGPAIDFYSRALALTPEQDLTARWELLLAREKVNDLLGERALQGEDLERLEALVEELSDDGKRAVVGLRKSQLALHTADYGAAVAAAQQAIALADAVADSTTQAAGHRLWGAALREQGAYGEARVQYEIARDKAQAAGASAVAARSLHDLGAVARLQADLDGACAYHEQALELYCETGDRRGEGLCRRSMAVVANSRGDYAGARVHAEKALRIAREIGDRQLESDCFNTLAIVTHSEGDLAGAQGYLTQALGMYRQLADRPREGLCLSNLGFLAWEQGDFAQAQSYLEQALDIEREVGNRWEESLCLENLGMVARDLGDHARARTCLQQGLDICRELGLREREGVILNELGIVATDLGRYDEAQATLEQALALRRELGRSQHLAETLVGLAQIAHDQGDREQGRTYITEVLALLEDSPGMSEAERPFRVHLVCYRVLRSDGDTRAEAVLERAYDLLQARAETIPDEATRWSFVTNVTVHREIVREYEEVLGSGVTTAP
jgi:predicted ATPase/class 3 adenylate cyclase/Tfp pilus assembly protein PilF